MATRKRPKTKSRRRQAVVIMAVFGVLALVFAVIAVGTLQTFLAKRSAGLYLQEHGVLAHAEIDSSERLYDICLGRRCTPAIVTYHFRDLTGTEHTAAAQLGHAQPQDGSDTLKIYYLPEDPSRQMPLESIPSLADVWGPFSVFMLIAAYFVFLCSHVYRRELGPRS